MSSLRRGYANLLCIVPILVYALPKQVHRKEIFPLLLIYDEVQILGGGDADNGALCLLTRALSGSIRLSTLVSGMRWLASLTLLLFLSGLVKAGDWEDTAKEGRWLVRRKRAAKEEEELQRRKREAMQDAELYDDLESKKVIFGGFWG